MRSERLENIIALLRSSDSNGPSTVDDWRVAYDNLGRLVPANPDIAVEPADGVRGEWIGDGDGSIVVYLHGGGYCIGSLTSHRAMLTHLAAAVDYRLAPEHPFPTPLVDCHDVLRWLHDHADRLGVDASRIAVGGASAGGGLAASLCQFARDRGGPAIAFQLLQYPMLDDRTALRRDAQALVWSNRSNEFGWSCYLGHPLADGEQRPHAVPARTEDLSALPPAWIGVGDIDLFHDEDVEYARRLTAAGVQCELHVVPGMYHAAEQFAPGAPSMQDFVGRMVDAVRAAVGAPDGRAVER